MSALILRCGRNRRRAAEAPQRRTTKHVRQPPYTHARKVYINNNMFFCLSIYIYIHIYVGYCVHVYTYLCVRTQKQREREREREREPHRVPVATWEATCFKKASGIATQFWVRQNIAMCDVLCSSNFVLTTTVRWHLHVVVHITSLSFSLSLWFCFFSLSLVFLSFSSLSLPAYLEEGGGSSSVSALGGCAGYGLPGGGKHRQIAGCVWKRGCLVQSRNLF